MQAAVGRVQLRKVIGFNRRRREIAYALHRGLSGIHGLKLAAVDNCSSKYHCLSCFPHLPHRF